MNKFVTFALAQALMLATAAGATAEAPTGSSDNSTTASRPTLSLDVEIAETSIRAGEQLAIKATITNHGREAVTLVQPGDGSACGWRTPLTGVSLAPAASDARHPDLPKPYTGPRCGNVNPLTREEIVFLRPGETMPLSDWFCYLPVRDPGKHRVVFYYANQPDKTWRGVPLGQHDAEAMKLVHASTPCQLKSRELIIDVLAAEDAR
ncbi:MAG: hypothetical protein RIC55_35980 [Pirellulaceae bacterium]